MSHALRWSPEMLAAHQKRRGVVERLRTSDVAVDRETARVIRNSTMNKLEARYAAEVLEPSKRAGDIVSYGFENLRLKLANRTWYWPDFMLAMPDGRTEIRECKGFMREDAWIKLKVCAALHPHIRIVVVREARLDE